MPITKITDKLYLCDYNSATKYAELCSLGIKQILTVGNGMLHRTEELRTKYIPIEDRSNENIKQYFTEAFEFINRDVTVVHCQMGISRSATIVIAYLMSGGMDINYAYRYVKLRRPFINPNSGFTEQLITYSLELGRYIDKYLFLTDTDEFDLSNPWDPLKIEQSYETK
jgi:protein-tyrosine phosphatase